MATFSWRVQVDRPTDKDARIGWRNLINFVTGPTARWSLSNFPRRGRQGSSGFLPIAYETELCLTAPPLNHWADLTKKSCHASVSFMEPRSPFITTITRHRISTQNTPKSAQTQHSCHQPQSSRLCRQHVGRVDGQAGVHIEMEHAEGVDMAMDQRCQGAAVFGREAT